MPAQTFVQTVHAINFMKDKTRYLFTILLILMMGSSVHARDEYSPDITIEQAIEKARQYAVKKDIDLTGKYVNKVEYHNNMRDKSKQPYWMVLWINRFVTKGGGVEVRLYENGSIEERYHK